MPRIDSSPEKRIYMDSSETLKVNTNLLASLSKDENLIDRIQNVIGYATFKGEKKFNNLESTALTLYLTSNIISNKHLNNFKEFCEANQLRFDPETTPKARQDLRLLFEDNGFKRALDELKPILEKFKNEKHEFEIENLESSRNLHSESANRSEASQASKLPDKNVFHSKVMKAVGHAMLSSDLSVNNQKDIDRLKSMAEKASVLGSFIEAGKHEKSLWFKRYGIDQDSLYEKLRTFSTELVTASGKCTSKSAQDRMLLMAAVMEMLAQQHNTNLISEHYDDAANELQKAHGKEFETPQRPHHAISHGKNLTVSIGGGLGMETQLKQTEDKKSWVTVDKGPSASLSGRFGPSKVRTVANDFEIGIRTVSHSGSINATLRGVAGTGVDTKAWAASLEGQASVTRTGTLFTAHTSYTDAFKGMISDTRETYIHKNPLQFFERSGYDAKDLAKAEIDAINTSTTVGPLNVLRNVGEGVRSFWNSGQNGIKHGDRPFNELTFLKAQSGASKAVLTNLLKHEISKENPDKMLVALNKLLKGEEMSSTKPQSNKTHHFFIGTITSTKGEVGGKGALGWHSPKVNEDVEHPVGMGVYGKASVWMNDIKGDFSLMAPPHDIVKRTADNYIDGETAALQNLLTQHSEYQKYAKEKRTPEELTNDLNFFREESTRMQCAKALLLNRQSRSNPVLADHVWREFKDAYSALTQRFSLKAREFDEKAPTDTTDHDKRLELVTHANNQLGRAWTALSLGLANARINPASDQEPTLNKLAKEIKEVDIPCVHPLTAYGHSPIRLQSTDYKNNEKGFSFGASFDIKLPSPIPTFTATDKTGSGKLKDILKTEGSLEGSITLKTEDKSGHPNPVRNGTFRTVALDVKLQLPSLPTGIPNPGWAIKSIAEQCGKKVADNIREHGDSEATQEQRNNMAAAAALDVADQLKKIFTQGLVPNNFIYTYEAQWHKTPGSKEVSHAYSQHRITVEANHRLNLPISAYAGLGFEIGLATQDRNTTTLAGIPRLGGSVYGHLLQYHEDGVLKPTLKKEGSSMTLDPNHPDNDALAQMYFSNDGVLDFLSECATLRNDGGLKLQNMAQFLVRSVGQENSQEEWNNKHKLTEEDITSINKVREETQGMSAKDRFNYFCTDDGAKNLFNKYLGQVEFLQKCNNYGKVGSLEKGWKLIAKDIT